MNRLKLQWIKLADKLDAMTLRERAMVFLATVGVVVFLIYTFALDPMLKRQKLLLEQIKQQNNQVSGIDMEIMAKAQAFAADPDAPVRAQLQSVRSQVATGTAALTTMEKGLVAPEKIAPLLEQILRGNGKLKLVSMKTLPVTGLNEAAESAAKGGRTSATGAGPGGTGAAPVAAGAAGQAGQPLNGAAPAPGQAPANAMLQAAVGAPAPGTPSAAAAPSAPGSAASKPRELLYRHGVEIVLQGSYPDMVTYMDALESMPTQLFWGKARLDAGAYPNSRLTLTLYTLSLDQKWMQL